MIVPPRRSPSRAVAALAAAAVLGCGCGGGARGAAAAPIAVAIAPHAVTVTAGATVQFGVAVTGTRETGVAWTVDEPAGCGAVTAAGRFTAPDAPATCHVTATSRADPARSDTATVTVTDGPASAWRPFGAASPWNVPIPADAALEPDSAALVADLASSSPFGARLDVAVEGWSVPLYWADEATPTALVTATAVGGEGWTSADGTNATALMPIPDGAAPDPQADHHMLVVDRARALEWGCWHMAFADGAWRAGVCATADLDGTGVRPPATVASPWWVAHGARACGFPLVAGLIRPEEIAAGRIEHALVLAYPHIRAGWFTPPASTSQARIGTIAVATRGIPCGGRIQLDPMLDLDALGLSRAGRIIARALQEYGAYVGDYAGSINLYADSSPAARAYWAGVLGTSELAGRIDLSRLRVIRYGPVYDGGNG